MAGCYQSIVLLGERHEFIKARSGHNPIFPNSGRRVNIFLYWNYIDSTNQRD
jgi:hypothetical protein